ncbi:phage tail P2-like protein [Sinobacterium caligoides]|uniref:Phage tail P2-like protein n=1 Tax=Sinobacterium caligoides TaxID=933926 RepID=A0A3N2E272_9GAMM|nr:phage tail protein I [Sinobacterium caligoides]ROS05675.1 phage tail P2-like protein [Sinobacterium caligoides]
MTINIKQAITAVDDVIVFKELHILNGIITGEIAITPLVTNEYDVTAYYLYWGDESGEIVGECFQYFSFDSFDKNGRKAFDLPINIVFSGDRLPLGARSVLVYLENNNEQILYCSRVLWSEESLLPPNASHLEKALAQLTQRVSQLPVELVKLWSPSQCPDNFLPWLADGVSVDNWYVNINDAMSESINRRNIIRNNASVHKHKGTVGSIKRALQSIGIETKITEAWEPGAVIKKPYYFGIELILNGGYAGGSNEQLEADLRRIIDRIKPARSRYKLVITMVQSADITMVPRVGVLEYLHLNMIATLPK